MDIARAKQPISWFQQHWKKMLSVAALTAIVMAATQIEVSAYSAQRNNLLIGTVAQGELTVNVRGNGVLVPSDIRWIAANVEGRVERVLVKPGAVVAKGDLLMELSNPQLRQLAEETRWELEASTEESKALDVALQSQLLDQKAAVINAEMLYESAKLRLDAEQTLLDRGKGSVSMLDYKKSKLETRQLKRRWDIEIERFAKLEENKTAQLRAKAARLKKLAKTLNRAEEEVASLQVIATLDGVVQEMPLEPGQRIAIGSNIAKLARQDKLIAELKIPERQIRDVVIGQKAVIDTRLNKVVGHVIRIDPAVNNGTVLVDIAFDQPLPGEARPDLSIDGQIEINQLSNTLYVGRPTFAQSQSTAIIYKVSADGQHAEKATVQFGIGSSNQIQIINGLIPGDQIILSDHSAWEHINRISIN
ncbi:MAG: HlyD family secretion protein [Phenylobacterium sp.]|jgi:HlyD family secretion protein